MNSVLQSLSNVPPLRRYLAGSDWRSDVNPSSPHRGRVAKALHGLLRDMWSSGQHGGVIAPSAVKSVVGKVSSQFIGYNQHDAQEFLRFLLDALHEDVNQVHRMPPYEELDEQPTDSDQTVADMWWRNYTERNAGVIVDLFAGQLRSCVTCSKCGNTSRAFDVFWDLSLPLPRSGKLGSSFGSKQVPLTQCLDLYIAPEKLEGSEAHYCRKCKTHQRSEKKLALWRAPPVLVLHLKRFTFGTFRRTKLTTAVDFPQTGLDVRPFAAEGSPVAAPGACTTYNLVAVVNHMGSLGGGHYTAHALNGGEWLTYNDSRVGPAHSLGQSEGYLLFYLRDDM